MMSDCFEQMQREKSLHVMSLKPAEELLKLFELLTCLVLLFGIQKGKLSKLSNKEQPRVSTILKQYYIDKKYLTIQTLL